MKKTISILIILIVGLFIGLSFLGRNGDYDAEKALWRVNKKFIELNRDPEGVPPNAFNAIYNEYEGLAKKFSNTKYAPGMRILAARVYVVQKRFDEARSVLESIVKQNDGDENVQMQALFEIGKTYELEKNMEAMISNLKRIQGAYPDNGFSRNVPVLIAKTYADFGKTGLSREAYYEAILGYEKTIKAYPGTGVALDAQYVIGAAYSALNKWDDAVDAFGRALLDYSTVKELDINRAKGIVQAINLISLKNTRDLEKPVKIYQTFIEQNENHPFNAMLEEIIRRFNVVEEKIKNAEVEQQKK